MWSILRISQKQKRSHRSMEQKGRKVGRMSIVIKGMRMPESCASCPFAERIPPGRTRCLLTCRLLAENYEAPSKLMRNEYCPIEERKKGKWIEKDVTCIDDELDDRNVIDEWQAAKCSVCGKWHTTPYLYSFDNYAYCPNCGAEMHGGKRDEQSKQ